MAFHFKPLVMGVGVILLGTGWGSSAFAIMTFAPSSPEACVVLQSNAERLACYDALFKAFEAENTVYVSQPKLDSANSVVSDSVKVESRRVETSSSSTISPKTSLLDSRWELSPESKLGTWNIRAYQPVYILPAFWSSDKNEQPESANERNSVAADQVISNDSIELKYQLSFKAKAFENIFGDNGDLWLGYTQSSRWQMYNAHESSPFREANYEPEASLIFRTDYEVLGLNGRLLGFTFNHQSNGREDPWSRSWNRLMLNIGLERDNFALMIRPWYRIKEHDNDDNPDITDYIGRGDVHAFYRYKEQDFSLMLRHTLKGGEESRGAVQFDWDFPIKGHLRGKFQVFHGYGESLVDYNHKATYVGLGVSLVDWF